MLLKFVVCLLSNHQPINWPPRQVSHHSERQSLPPHPVFALLKATISRTTRSSFQRHSLGRWGRYWQWCSSGSQAAFDTHPSLLPYFDLFCRHLAGLQLTLFPSLSTNTELYCVCCMNDVPFTSKHASYFFVKNIRTPPNRKQKPTSQRPGPGLCCGDPLAWQPCSFDGHHRHGLDTNKPHGHRDPDVRTDDKTYSPRVGQFRRIPQNTNRVCKSPDQAAIGTGLLPQWQSSQLVARAAVWQDIAPEGRHSEQRRDPPHLIGCCSHRSFNPIYVVQKRKMPSWFSLQQSSTRLYHKRGPSWRLQNTVSFFSALIAKLLFCCAVRRCDTSASPLTLQVKSKSSMLLAAMETLVAWGSDETGDRLSCKTWFWREVLCVRVQEH